MQFFTLFLKKNKANNGAASQIGEGATTLRTLTTNLLRKNLDEKDFHNME
jgi:hypothetical protein